jgi:hypothetical protein
MVMVLTFAEEITEEDGTRMVPVTVDNIVPIVTVDPTRDEMVVVLVA